MSFISDDELLHLEIDRMILHVVGGPTFNIEPEITNIEHSEFFLARIKKANLAPLFRFSDDSPLVSILSSISEDPNNFESASQAISRRFHELHQGNAKDGAFFVFKLFIGHDDGFILSLVKYDYSSAIELYEEEGASALREIVHAFVEDQAAVQKIALIRVRNNEVEMQMAAKDRMGKSPDVTDYFATFLGVQRERSNEQLTQAARDAIRDTVSDCRDFFADAGAALRAAQDALRTRLLINNESIAEALFSASDQPDSDEARAEISRVLLKKLRQRKILGLEFAPEASVLDRPLRKRVKTREDILLEYPTNLEGQSVRKNVEANGEIVFTIRTREVLNVKVIPDSARNRT